MKILKEELEKVGMMIDHGKTQFMCFGDFPKLFVKKLDKNCNFIKIKINNQIEYCQVLSSAEHIRFLGFYIKNKIGLNLINHVEIRQKECDTNFEKILLNWISTN
jgi:hypothetical protein